MGVQFAGKTFVVLGHLSTMTKHDAWIRVQSLGGSVSNTPRPSSDYFIQGSRVSASRQARAEELGFPILTEQEFIDEVARAQAESERGREHVELGDAIASFRGLFDGPPSYETWGEVTDLLDACPDAQLADACRYVESHVARWPDHRSSDRAPAMLLDRSAHYTPFIIDPLCDGRVALKPWLRELCQGIESPKFELVRRLNLNGMSLTGSVLTHFVQNPTLTNLREIDVGVGNSVTQTFYKKLRASEHLPALDTLTLRDMSEKHARALCGDHTLTGLRWVKLGHPKTRYAPDELESIYARLFEAEWWTQIEGLDLQVSRLFGVDSSTHQIHGVLARSISNLPRLRHLILGDPRGVEELYGSPVLTQIERLTLHSCGHEPGIQLLRHLDAHPGHSIRALDLSRCVFDSRGEMRYAHTGRRAYFECLLELERLDAFEEIVLPRPGSGDPIEALTRRAEDAGVTLTPSPIPE